MHIKQSWLERHTLLQLKLWTGCSRSSRETRCYENQSGGTLQVSGHLSGRDTFEQLPLNQHVTERTEFTYHISNPMPGSSNNISVFHIRAIAALDSSVVSDDIGVAPEVQAEFESNCQQQSVLFIYMSINGHGKVEGEAKGREGREGLAEDDGERTPSCCESSLSRVLFY